MNNLISALLVTLITTLIRLGISDYPYDIMVIKGLISFISAISTTTIMDFLEDNKLLNTEHRFVPFTLIFLVINISLELICL